MFEAMADRPVDFWGLTSSRRMHPHVQSFFVAFRPWLVESQAFARFWHDMSPGLGPGQGDPASTRSG